MVISRSGYTTIMDLVKLQKKAILIPTPGQTEQEYLAEYLNEKKMFYSVEQKNFSLKGLLDKAKGFQFNIPTYDMKQYKKVIHQFVESLSKMSNKRMNQNTKAHAGLLATNLFFAANISAVKYFTYNNLIGAYAINLLRIGVSVFLFWLIFLFSRTKEKIEKKHIQTFMWCALTAIALNQMLFVKGLSYTFSIHASLLLLTSPILITFIAAWILKEKINTTKIIGLLLGISGATILITSRKSAGSGNDVIWGDILVLMSTVFYTIYFILVKPLMNRYSSLM